RLLFDRGDLAEGGLALAFLVALRLGGLFTGGRQDVAAGSELVDAADGVVRRLVAAPVVPAADAGVVEEPAAILAVPGPLAPVVVRPALVVVALAELHATGVGVPR